MKLRIVLASSPLNSPFFEDGIEVALTAADLEVETEVVLTGAFLEYVKNTSPDDIVLKKLKQLELYEIEPFYEEDQVTCSDPNIKQIVY
ncbi:hypothetical protein [Succinatimonas hippei]|uniref:hypothetical protein n=1 Tax=Succinatimonas hippei TaxID=626938 RepID=UPI00255CF23A|nr:hypothetical protein [Succinatimonas hippei]